jgi:hypothetical protein
LITTSLSIKAPIFRSKLEKIDENGVHNLGPPALVFCRYLAVAASLTGGNALAAFIKMIQVGQGSHLALPGYTYIQQHQSRL